MESMSAIPSDPAADLAAAESARQRLTGSLRMPAWFYSTLGAATTIQIGGAAYGLSDNASGVRMLALLGGALVFVGAAFLLLVRFRRLNHVRIDGLFSKALMGSSMRSSLAEAGGLAAAVWAAQTSHWWLAGLASVAGGAAYAVSARLWWVDYQRDPAGRARHVARGPAARLPRRAPRAVRPARGELMSEIDPLIHPPSRLQLMTMLTAVSDAEFVTLRDALGVSDSVLSKHVSALAGGGYVKSRKGVVHGRRTTWVSLTKAGDRALRSHTAALRALIDLVDGRLPP
jgi:DNA-binding MarR family transcriptional regulator